MTPQTRSSNQKVDYKIYYSKKPPKQLLFPAHNKTVRTKKGNKPKPQGPERQLRIGETVGGRIGRVEDSEDEDDSQDEDEEVGAREQENGIGIEHGEPARPAATRRRKSKVLQEEEADQELGKTSQKRRRISNDAKKAMTTKSEKPTSKRSIKGSPATRTGRLKRESSEPEDRHPPEEPASEEEETRSASKRRKRPDRQSTMTQFARGDKPSPGSAEPDFVPVKKPRRSLGKGKEKGQQTLTQMVPGMFGGRTIEDSGDETDDDEEQEEDEAEANHADDTYFHDIGEHLAQQGVYQPADRAEEQTVSRTSKTPELPTGKISLKPPPPEKMDAGTKNAKSAAFLSPRSILSTPQRRRMREIPSSQSPSESLLSTQTTPQTLRSHRRSPLKARSGNLNTVLDTPSKKKQVTFLEPTKRLSSLRRIGSVVMDSDDDEEEEELSEDEEPAIQGGSIGAQTQAMIQHIDQTDIGAETQAMIRQIDQVCANAEEDATILSNRDLSEELGGSKTPRNHQESYAGASEIQHRAPVADPVQPYTPVRQRSPYSGLPKIKQEPLEEGEEDETITPRPPTKIKQEPTDDEETTPQSSINHPSNSQPPSPSTFDQDTLDLNDPHPPSPSQHTQNTTTSHTLEAEAQIQTEYLSYSQYPRLPPPSSMHVQSDETFTYQQTPHPLPTQRLDTAANPKTSHPPSFSQATTVDSEPSPRKSFTTPQRKSTRFSGGLPDSSSPTQSSPFRIPDSQPPLVGSLGSPVRPPPLLIPSSVPTSPVRGLMEGERMTSSSPVFVVGDSLEEGVEFSIPEGPPVDLEEW